MRIVEDTLFCTWLTIDKPCTLERVIFISGYLDTSVGLSLL